MNKRILARKNAGFEADHFIEETRNGNRNRSRETAARMGTQGLIASYQKSVQTCTL